MTTKLSQLVHAALWISLVVAGCGIATPKASSAPPVPDMRFEGTDKQSGPVKTLPAGTYRATWTTRATDPAGCVLSIALKPIAADDLFGILASESAFDDAPHSGSTIGNLSGGTYAWDIQGLDCRWSVDLERLGV